MDKNTFIKKIPAYIYRYKGFSHFLSLINDYILNAYEELANFIKKVYDYMSGSILLDDVEAFILESIVNVLNIKIPEINKENRNYKNYLDLAIKSVIINRTFDGGKESLQKILGSVFGGSTINIIDGGLSGSVSDNMHLEVDVDDIVLNDIPYDIFRKYVTPKILGVTSNFTYKQGDTFSYDVDFNEAVRIYNNYKDNPELFLQWVNTRPEIKYLIEKSREDEGKRSYWDNIWSGSLMISPDILDTEIEDQIDQGITEGSVSRSGYYTGMTNTNIDGYDLSLDATIYEMVVNMETGDILVEDNLIDSISKPISGSTSNVPFTTYDVYTATTIYKPTKSGSAVIQNVDLGWEIHRGQLYFKYVIVENLYKYETGENISPEEYIKICREINNRTGLDEDIEMWISPEDYGDGVVVTKTLYGFTNNEELEEYKEENPKNNSVYVLEV